MSRLFDCALLCWPRDHRARDGELVLDTAQQLVADGQSGRLTEAAGIAKSGLSLRFSSSRFASAPWSGAASLLLLPLLVVLLVANIGQQVLLVPGYPAQALDPGFSMTLLTGLVLLATISTLASKRNVALAATLGSALVLIARIYRAETLGAWPGIQHELAFGIGDTWSFGVNADAALLPAIALAVVCCLILRRSNQPVRYAPAWATLLLAAASLLAAWALTANGLPNDTYLNLNQVPAMFLLFIVPPAFFGIAILTRAKPEVRLAASLSLAVAGPGLSWVIAGLPAFYNWPDFLVLTLMLAMQVLWIGALLTGVATSGPSSRRTGRTATR